MIRAVDRLSNSLWSSCSSIFSSSIYVHHGVIFKRPAFKAVFVCLFFPSIGIFQVAACFLFWCFTYFVFFFPESWFFIRCKQLCFILEIGFVSLRFLSAETYTSDWTGWVSKLIFPFGKIWHEVFTENTRMFWEDNFFYLPTEAPRAKEKSNSTGIKLSTELVICNHLIFKANNLKTSAWMCSLVLCQLALTSHPPHETLGYGYDSEF